MPSPRDVPYSRGAHQIADGVWAYLQPDGGWGLSNAGLVASADGASSLLVDTLFDLHLTGEMLSTLRQATPAAERIATVVNTHANGDHCYGNALVAGADIVASQACAEEMAALPPAALAGLMRAAPDMEAFARASTPLPMFYELGGGGAERARIVCCFLGCDQRPFNPLLTALPRVIHLSPSGGGTPTGWLGTLLSMAAKESGSVRAGTENVLARLSELMFVETIRQYLETLPPAQPGWLAGLRDPVVGHALAVLHRAPHESWTVERLARAVGLSRSVLAERFTLMINQPPMQYLALWRMQLASRLLREGGQVAATAAAVGYESESAFSRTFKKLVGQAPGAWCKGGHRSRIRPRADHT